MSLATMYDTRMVHGVMNPFVYSMYVLLRCVVFILCVSHCIKLDSSHSFLQPSLPLSSLLLTKVWYDVETYAAYDGNRRASIDTPLSKVQWYG